MINKRGGVFAYIFWVTIGALIGGWFALNVFCECWGG